MKTHESHAGSIEIFELSGKLMGGSELDAFRTSLRDAITRGHRQFVVDMAGVEWVNSCGLGALIGAYVSVMRSGGRIVFANCDSVTKLLDTTRLTEIFDIYPSRQEALGSFVAALYDRDK